MPLTKETTDMAAGQNPGRPRATGEKIEDASHPQPVCIEVPVTVQGVRPATDPGKREPFTESTRTVIVFASGAVVRLGTAVNPGQLIFLTNKHTKKEVVCQVVKSKTYQNVAGYIELEFTEPNVGFWGIHFPGERSEPQREPQAPSVSQFSPKPQPLASVPQIRAASAVPPGTNEVASTEAEPLPQKGAVSPAALLSASTPSAKPAATPRSDPVHAKAAPVLRTEGSTGISEPLVFSGARKAATLVPTNVEQREDDHAAPMFGSSSLFEEGAEAQSAVTKSRPFPAVPLIAAALILAVAGGGWYWWRNSGGPGLASSSPRPANLAPAPAPLPPPGGMPSAQTASSPVTDTSKPVEVSSQPSAPAPAQPQPQPVNASMTSPEASRPAERHAPASTVDTQNKKSPAISGFRLSAPHTGRGPSLVKSPEPAPGMDSAPAIPSVASDNSVSTLVGGSASQPAAPKPEPPTGGELRPARLVSSAPPVYPPLARSQRVEGDVTVDALIDATGRMTTIKVISGPVLLQQAAVAAVQLWKYEPATLNGGAVPMHVTVIVKFRLR